MADSTKVSTPQPDNAVLVFTRDQSSAMTEHLINLQQTGINCVPILCEDRACFLKIDSSMYSRMDLLVGEALCAAVMDDNRLHQDVHAKLKEFEINNKPIHVVNMCSGNEDFDELYFHIPRKARRRIEGDCYKGAVPGQSTTSQVSTSLSTDNIEQHVEIAISTSLPNAAIQSESSHGSPDVSESGTGIPEASCSSSEDGEFYDAEEQMSSQKTSPERELSTVREGTGEQNGGSVSPPATASRNVPISMSTDNIDQDVKDTNNVTIAASTSLPNIAIPSESSHGSPDVSESGTGIPEASCSSSEDEEFYDAEEQMSQKTTPERELSTVREGTGEQNGGSVSPPVTASKHVTTGMTGGEADGSNVTGAATAGRDNYIGNTFILAQEAHDVRKSDQVFLVKNTDFGLKSERGNTPAIDPDEIQLTVTYSKEMRETVIKDILPNMLNSEGVKSAKVTFGSIIITLTLEREFIITEEWKHNILRTLFSGQLASCISEGETFTVTLQKYIVYEGEGVPSLYEAYASSLLQNGSVTKTKLNSQTELLQSKISKLEELERMLMAGNTTILVQETHEARKGDKDFQFANDDFRLQSVRGNTNDPDEIQLIVNFTKEMKEKVILDVVPNILKSKGVRSAKVKFGPIIITLTLEREFIITEEWKQAILRTLFSGQLASCISEGETFTVTIQKYIVYEGEGAPSLCEVYANSLLHNGGVTKPKLNSQTELLQSKISNLEEELERMRMTAEVIPPVQHLTERVQTKLQRVDDHGDHDSCREPLETEESISGEGCKRDSDKCSAYKEVCASDDPSRADVSRYKHTMEERVSGKLFDTEGIEVGYIKDQGKESHDRGSMEEHNDPISDVDSVPLKITVTTDDQSPTFPDGDYGSLETCSDESSALMSDDESSETCSVESSDMSDVDDGTIRIINEKKILLWEELYDEEEDPSTLTALETSVQKLKQETEFKEKIMDVLSLFDKQRMLDCLTYLKLYRAKTHIYSLLPGSHGDTKEKMYSTDESHDTYTEDPETGRLLGVWHTAGDMKTEEAQYSESGQADKGFSGHIEKFPVLKSASRHKSEMQHKKQTLKKSEPESGLAEDTKMSRQDEGCDSPHDVALADRLQDLKKKSVNQDEEVRKNPTDLLEWKPKADSLVMELSPIIMNRYITNLIGDGVVLATDDRSLDFKASRAPASPVTSSSSQVHLLREFQYGRLHKRQLRDLLGKAIIEDSSSLSDLEAKSGRLERVFGRVYIFSQTDPTRSFPVSCPSMTLSRERVREDLAVAGEAGQFLTNTERSRGTDHRPDQFKHYRGTCSAPLPLPESPYTRTVPRYWETNSRVQGKERHPDYVLLQMAVTDEVDRWVWVSGVDPGWSVVVRDCEEHTGCYCISVWENGRLVGECLSTIPSPTHGNDVEIRLGIVLDVGRGRLAFIDVNREKVLYKFDVTFRQPPFPVFGVWPDSDYAINMELVSGGEIAITDSKKRLIAEALFSS